MNAQETFDLVSLHLLTQNSVCKNASEFNTYAHDGSYSAIGAYLKKVDPTYLSQIDSTEPENLTLTNHRDLLLELENVHDRYQPDEWLGQLHAVAKLRGLSFDGVPYGQDDTIVEHTFSLTFKVRTPSEDTHAIAPEALMEGIALATKEGRIKENAVSVYNKRIRQQPFAAVFKSREIQATITLLAYDEDDALESAESQVVYGEVVSVKKISWDTYNELQAIAA